MAEADSHSWTCQTCSNIGLVDGGDGYFYCLRCGSQAEDICDTGVADEDFVDKGTDGGALYVASLRRQRPRASAADVVKAEPISQSDYLCHGAAPISQSQFWSALTLTDDGEAVVKLEEDFDDGEGPTSPDDFGWIGKSVPKFEDYRNEIRIRYVMGLQLMIQLQCEALIREFKVSPLIAGLAGTVWLRFVASTRIFDDDWADAAIEESENRRKGEPPRSFKRRCKYGAEPFNMYGERALSIWLRALRKAIPLTHTLTVSFLACHLAREAILATDIERWALEGKLPYFSAFVEIEKNIGKPSRACQLSASCMFRPLHSDTAQKLESQAASVAESVGLTLPPVNFYAIASRFLRKLSLPLEEILPHALRLYEWAMPPNLWLSSNELRLPTYVEVLSVLIVVIRIRYNINGFGEWEKGLSSNCPSPSPLKPGPDLDTEEPAQNSPPDVDFSRTNNFKNTSPVQTSKGNHTAELLCKLEAMHKEIKEIYTYASDLTTYVQFCKDVVYAGLEPSFEDHDLQNLIELLDLNQGDKEFETPGKEDTIRSKQKKSRTWPSDDQPETISENGDTKNVLKDEAIKQLKLDMEENRFCYIPPRKNAKRSDYLHYVRKQDEGALAYVAHADYYILLRACAKVAQIEMRIMHMGVLALERRLAWLEHRITHCLHLTPPSFTCKFCRVGDASEKSMGVSDLNI